MAIVQQLQAETGSLFASATNQSVTLGAGANRLFLVAISLNINTLTLTTVRPNLVSYGGAALLPVTDGANVAQSVLTLLFPSGALTILVEHAVFWYVLRETELPANGANNLHVSFVTAPNFAVGWWILENCSQSPNVRSVANASTVAAVATLATTLGIGSTSDACFVLGLKDETAGTIQITIGGVGLTEDFDISLSTFTARAAAGTDLTAPSLGSVVCDMSYTLPVTPAAVISAIRIQEFSVPGGDAELSGERSGSVALSAQAA